jgi:hypothetical protein
VAADLPLSPLDDSSKDAGLVYMGRTPVWAGMKSAAETLKGSWPRAKAMPRKGDRMHHVRHTRMRR